MSTAADTETVAEPGAGTTIPGEIVPGSPEEAASIEERARRLGWKDKTEFSRPPERWVDAKTFLDRGESTLPILRENFRNLEAQLGATLAQNREMTAQVSALNASVDHLRELAMSADRVAYDRARKEFESQKRYLEQTIDAGASRADVATVARAREALVNLTPPPAPRAAPTLQAPTVMPGASQAPAVNPVEQAAVQAFVRSEPWFKSREREALGEGNAEASDYASARYSAVQRERPDLTPSEQLSEVRRSVSKRFPELFQNSAAGRPQAVSAPAGGNGSARSTASGSRWAEIPAADRSAAEKMIADVNKGRKDGKTFTQAEYASLYFKGQA